MTNLSLSFLNSPWFLLLIPLAVALTLIPYFRLAKRYRRTRNRIVSIVMHLIVSVLAISVLAGMQFTYETPNEKNELILIVDASYSGKNAVESRDELVDELLKDSIDYNCKVGIVAFGFDQTLVSNPTTDVTALRNDYADFKNAVASSECDTTATDIAAAFRIAGRLLENPASGKVVLVSDGKETDEQALGYIRTLTSKGVKIDVIRPSDAQSYGQENEIQICDVTFPQDYIQLFSETTIKVKVKSTVSASMTFKIYDNKTEENASPAIEEVRSVSVGEQEITFSHTFKEVPFHIVDVDVAFTRVTIEEPTTENNTFTTYLTIEKFDRILIIEKYEGDSVNLESLLSADNENVELKMKDPFPYQVTTVLLNTDEFDTARQDLSSFDQIIFNNVANGDLPDGFIEEVEEYVDGGGGLLTVGGNDPDGKVHVYDRDDLNTAGDTLYQDMLPVSAVDYTPPMGVAFIIDISGSMSGDKLIHAKAGLEAIARYSLTDRDYMSIFTLDTEYGDVLPLTPRSNMNTIINAIYSIGGSGGTVATNAISRAAQSLNSAGNNIARKHIILLSDGQFGDKTESGKEPPYITEARLHYESSGITLSMVGIGLAASGTYYDSCKKMTDAAHGTLFANVANDKIGEAMKEALGSRKIEALTEGVFRPVVSRATDPVFRGINIRGDATTGSSDTFDFALGAFYGGKIKQDATLVLTDRFNAPIYAYWNYGKGKVGSIMCDLKGTDDSYSRGELELSEKRKQDDGTYKTEKVKYGGIFNTLNGQMLISGIVRELMPDTRLTADEINVKLDEENYINTVTVYESPKSNEKVEAFIEKMNDDKFVAVSLTEASSDNGSGVYVITPLSSANLFTRCQFVIRKPGVYKITVSYVDSDGNVRKTEKYKSFSYSAEYDMFDEDGSKLAAANELLAALAERGGGKVITSVANLPAVFGNFDPTIKHVYDPRVLFMIIAIVAMLIDVAVRKFKFKWIHEIIREAKEKKEGR